MVGAMAQAMAMALPMVGAMDKQNNFNLIFLKE